MRWRSIYLILATVGAVLAGEAKVVAQSPAAVYNYNRAYQHFLGSRYSYRTYTSYTAGASRATYTPFMYQSQYIEPSYSRQRITPAGYDRYDYIPGYGGAFYTPFGMGGYYFRGYHYGMIAPVGGDVAEYIAP